MLRTSLVFWSALLAVSTVNTVAFADLIFTTRVGSVDANEPTGIPGESPVLIGTISALPNEYISISKIGIGGDSDFGSGDNRFRAVGGGIDFTWVAGQQATFADFRLDSTPIVSGPTAAARGFSSADVSFDATVGASVNIFWDYRYDYDGRYTYASDPLGTFYDDSAFISSIRPFVQYSLESTTAVPEPSSMVLFTVGGMALVFAMRRRSTSVK